MSFATAVQWWEEWQLRLLVLASLFFQYFLFVAALVRKRRVPPWFRALIWLAYQGGDVVAIYALATLFNQHKEEVLVKYPASAHLDTLWAPVLLLHLGGQDGITAYSIEDNENWRRYLLLAVCQITVAVYVFRTSWWSGDLILLRAAILLFIPGILKCLEKPWALKNATATSLINSSDSRMKATFDDDDGELQKDIYSQEQYVQAAVCPYSKFEPQDVELFSDEVADHPFHLLVDLTHPYSIRLRNLQLLAPRAAVTAGDVHRLVRSSLSRAFDRLYTKHKASFGGLLRAAVVLLTFVDIGLFQRSRRRDGVYHRADVVVTYVLLSFTAALELVSACLVLGSGLPNPDDQLSQYNLVGYLARSQKRPWFWAMVRMLGARLQLDRLWCTAPPEPSVGVTRLVYDHLAAGWKDYIWRSLYEHDAAAAATGSGRWKRKETPAVDGVVAYRRFNDSRGQRTLEREGLLNKNKSRSGCAIEESLQMPFDESVVVWHLATEFCYFDHVDTGHDATRHSRMISNYMAYLLFVEPEMLVPGARSKLFRATYHELKKMLKPPPPPEEDDEATEVERKAPPPRAKNEMVRKVIQKVKSTIGHLGSEELVYKAWAVAHELMEFAKEKEENFNKNQKAREDGRKKVMDALRCAKIAADEFIDAKKRQEVLNKLVEVMHSVQDKAKVMRSAREKADKPDWIKSIKEAKGDEAKEKAEQEWKSIKEAKEKAELEFIKSIKEAKDKAELFIKEQKAKKRTEYETITKLLQCAKYQAEEVIKNEQEKKEPPEVCCPRTDTAVVNEFCKIAEEVIKEANYLVEEVEKKELENGKKNAKQKAEEFITEATVFIDKEKKKDRTKEEATKLIDKGKKKDRTEEEEAEMTKLLDSAKNKAKEMTKLLDDSAKNKAKEFVNNEKKLAAEASWEDKVKALKASWEEQVKELKAVMEFSEKAGVAIKPEDEKVQKLEELKEWHLIVDKEELQTIRSREHGDERMWAVIQGVWVEMLCFSAGRCRGYLHAKSLGDGGEYLSYVWLLLNYMGMETMPERMQRPEPHTVGDTGSLVKTPADEDSGDEDDDGRPAQGRTAAPRRRRASHVAPSATPQPQPQPQPQREILVTSATPQPQPQPATSVTSATPQPQPATSLTSATPQPQPQPAISATTATPEPQPAISATSATQQAQQEQKQHTLVTPLPVGDDIV